MAPPSASAAGTHLRASLFSPPLLAKPPLPRGNRGETRRTFRLITVLQFNEKPVSVLSVHNGRTKAYNGRGGAFDREDTTSTPEAGETRRLKGGDPLFAAMPMLPPPPFFFLSFSLKGLKLERALGWDFRGFPIRRRRFLPS